MNFKLSLVVATTVSAVCGCAEWPPQERYLVDNFYESRQGIETLKTRFQESEFGEIAMIDGDAIGYKEAGEPKDGDYELLVEEVNDSGKWVELFEQTSTQSINSNEYGGVSLTISQKVLSQDPVSIASYNNGSLERTSLLRCKETSSNIRCGFCRVDLDEGWWIRFGWWPVDFAEKERLAFQNGEMTYHEYSSIIRRKHLQCFEDGGTPIG